MPCLTERSLNSRSHDTINTFCPDREAKRFRTETGINPMARERALRVEDQSPRPPSAAPFPLQHPRQSVATRCHWHQPLGIMPHGVVQEAARCATPRAPHAVAGNGCDGGLERTTARFGQPCAMQLHAKAVDGAGVAFLAERAGLFPAS